MQTIQREAVKRNFVPVTTDEVATYTGEPSNTKRVIASVYTNDIAHPQPARHVKNRPARHTLYRVASTIAWALLGHKTFVHAISQDRIPAALVGGSLAAGTVYVQDRSARRAHLVSPHAVSKRSVLSLYAVMGFGLGLGAMLLNRGRR